MKAASALLKKLAKLNDHDLNGLIKFAESKDFPQRERLHSWSDLLKLYRARPVEAATATLSNENNASSPDSNALDNEPNEKQSKKNEKKKETKKKSPILKKKSQPSQDTKSKRSPIRGTGDNLSSSIKQIASGKK
jgi:hypothetical protein